MPTYANRVERVASNRAQDIGEAREGDLIAEEAEGEGEGALALLNRLQVVLEGVGGFGVLCGGVFHGDMSDIRFKQGIDHGPEKTGMGRTNLIIASMDPACRPSQSKGSSSSAALGPPPSLNLN